MNKWRGSNGRQRFTPNFSPNFEKFSIHAQIITDRQIEIEFYAKEKKKKIKLVPPPLPPPPAPRIVRVETRVACFDRRREGRNIRIHRRIIHREYGNRGGFSINNTETQW